jgi:hypothetical protein
VSRQAFLVGTLGVSEIHCNLKEKEKTWSQWDTFWQKEVMTGQWGIEIEALHTSAPLGRQWRTDSWRIPTRTIQDPVNRYHAECFPSLLKHWQSSFEHCIIFFFHAVPYSAENTHHHLPNNRQLFYLHKCVGLESITVLTRFEVRTNCDHSNTGIMGSNSSEGMHLWPPFLCWPV